MSELRHVWVCCLGMSLVRADHIIGLGISTPNGSAIEPDRVIGATDARLWATIAGKDGPVPLADGSGDAVQSLMRDLPELLASAHDSASAHLYVHHDIHRDTGVCVWKVTDHLPDEWPQRAEHRFLTEVDD